jgi:GNAT superfamily N-acetyltransferase
VRIRRADEEDLSVLAKIFASSAGDLLARFRPQTDELLPVDPEERLPTYRHLYATGALLVAEDPEPVAFSAAIVRDGVWFLSQLWVLPERQGRGIGASLLDETLAWGRSASAFSVIASPHPGAQTLYLRRSMFPLWMQIDMTVDAVDAGEMPEGAEALSEEDRKWLEQIDREVRGVARPVDHDFWQRSASGVALRRAGRTEGYVYAWPPGGWGSRPMSKIGPGAVRDPRDMPSLLAAARHLVDGPVTVAVPSTNWSALNELIRLGFRPSGTNTFMASRPLPDGSRYLSSGGSLG